MKYGLVPLKLTPEMITLRLVVLMLCGWGMLFCIIHLLHMQFLVVDVIFYEALKDLLLATVIFWGGYFVLFKKRRPLTPTNEILTIGFGLACGYIFSITVPTIIDRSLSAYILEKIDQRGGYVRQDAMLDIFVDEFIPESQLMSIRLQEALSSGTIVIEDGCIILTRKGERVAGFTRFYRNNLLPKKRLLLDRVTDELTDPFRHSPQSVDYLCDIDNN